MIHRSTNTASLLKTLSPFIEAFSGFDINDWRESSLNIVLTDNDEDFSLFEYDKEGCYSGHLFCRGRRGSDAIYFGQECLEYMFSTIEAKVIKGLTPVEKKHAAFVMRRLGFTSYGNIDTIGGPMQLFILTNREWSELNG